jgi:hypothetical protein
LPTPSVNRGTLILLAPNAASASISQKNPYFVFQYNPEKLIHIINQAAASATTQNVADPQNPIGEFYNLTFNLDSVEAEATSQNPSTLGLHPSLAMLELMMQPQPVGNQVLLPIVVFKWGVKRIVATRIVTMSVDETAFDGSLNPTRATVSLTLRVLDAAEVGNNPGARNVCLDHKNAVASLADAYRIQTGQPTAGQGKVTGAAATSTVQSKTNLSA